MSALVSVIIPAYNAGSFIAEILSSVLAQTYRPLEIIVVDDGSQDDTARKAAECGAEIRVIRQENAGPSAARNTGIQTAKSEWIAFLDADDQWTRNKLVKQIQIMEKDPSLALIASDMAEIDPKGEVIVPSVLGKHGMKDFFEYLGGAPIPDALAALVKKNFIPTGTVLAKKEALLECGGFNPQIRYGEDLKL
ncbi:MAG: glycosyltransferase family 2 protein [Desulfuromonadales bacterium]|nr:glycosyltransferase family 2 protein [Desulfuromonadales bacterium]